jgi:hypothetical protein
MPRRFQPPWIAERIPGGYVVKDATGQAHRYNAAFLSSVGSVGLDPTADESLA